MGSKIWQASHENIMTEVGTLQRVADLHKVEVTHEFLMQVARVIADSQAEAMTFRQLAEKNRLALLELQKKHDKIVDYLADGLSEEVKQKPEQLIKI